MHTLEATIAAPHGLPFAGMPLAGRGDAGKLGRSRQLSELQSLIGAIVTTLAVLSTAAFGNPTPTSYLYGIDDSAVLWVTALSGTSATFTSGTLFSTGLTPNVNGLAYDTAGEQLFVVDGNNDLYWWKQGASNFSFVASASALGISSGQENQPWGAAYYDNAYWFFRGSGNAGNPGLGSNVLEKVSLNLSGAQPVVTGTTTFTVPEISGSNAFGDIAIATSGPNQGLLYAYTFSDPGNFYSLNLNTIGSGTSGYNLISTTSGTGLQIAFSPDYSVLYGHNYTDGKWYTVDTGNGTLTELTNSGTSTPKFRDLGGSSVQAVPEPDTLALAAMGGGIVAWQVSRRRRRRAQSEKVAGIAGPVGPVVMHRSMTTA